MSTTVNNRWSPFDPKWYQAAFDQYTGTAEELFNTDFIIQQGFHVPDSDGSRNSIFRDSAVLNNTFNEQDVRNTLVDIYLNTTHHLAASNHDNTHFFRWYGYMSDFKVIPNTKYCEMVIPTDQFISPKERDLYKLRQFYRKWISVQDILNNWDVFKWHCMLFINRKVYSEYMLRIDDHEVTIRFEYNAYWYKKNMPVYIYKLDTNAQCRIKISRELCENQWDWRVPIDQIPDKRVLNSKNIIVAFNKISDPDHRKDGLERVEVLGDNLEFLTIDEDGYIDLSKISNFNRQYIRSELSEYLWMSIIVPKFFHEYPIVLPADVIYRPYEANFQKVSIVEGDFVQHVKADVSGTRAADQLYVDTNGGPGSGDDGWIQMIRPVVLADAYDGTYPDPYVAFLDELRELRDATVKGADLIEQLRFDVSDALVNDGNLDPYLDKLVGIITNIHELHNGFLDKLLIEYNQEYEAKYKNFLNVIDSIRKEGSKSEWLHADQKSESNFWNIVSPMIHIPRALVGKYNVIETTNMVEQNKILWNEPENYSGKLRYQHPVAEEDFWIFEYSSGDKVWRPVRMDVTHKFPDVYLLKDPSRDITGRVFKAFFFYSDTMNVRNPAKDIERPTADWEKDVQEYHMNQMGTYRDVFMEKFYWMGVRAIYRGYLLTKNRWEAVEYVIDNDSYQRFNELFMKTVDPYFKLGMATYLKSENFGFPFDDAVAKIQEAMGTKWLGYRKITNFEQYLNKNWKPSYVDSIVHVHDNFDPSDRLVRRPRGTFDIDRILPILIGIQKEVDRISAAVDDELEWIMSHLEEEDYNLILEYFQNLKTFIDQLSEEAGKSIKFLQGVDPAVFSVDDVNGIIASILSYLSLVDSIESALNIIDDDATEKNHHERKHAILIEINKVIATLHVYVERVLSVISYFDVDKFMEGANNLYTYFEHTKENPDDNSLLGYINDFNDAWSKDVKERRNAFFSSSATVSGMFVSGKSYTPTQIKDLITAVDKARSDLRSLHLAINEFYRSRSAEVDQTIIDRLEYSTENLDGLAEHLKDYMAARQALIDQFNIIREYMEEYNTFIPGDTENGYESSICNSMDEILNALSYLASDGDSKKANDALTSMVETGKIWTKFVDFEEQVFIRIFNLVHPPVAFMEELRSYDALLKAIVEYLQTVNWDFVPDAYLAKYANVYDISGVEITHPGFRHKTGNEVYIPELASYRVASVTDDVGAAKSLLKLRYRSTSFRDPMVQETPYDSITDGDGLGIMVRPTSVTKTPIVCDNILRVLVQKIENTLYLVQQSAMTSNSYDNYNLQEDLNLVTEIATQWDSIKESYGEHVSKQYKNSLDELISSMQAILPLGESLLGSRNSIKLNEIINLSNSLIDKCYEKATNLGKVDESYAYYEDSLITVVRSLANFYGNGSAWSDVDRLQGILSDLKNSWSTFFRSTDIIYEDSELSAGYQELVGIIDESADAIVRTLNDRAELLRVHESISAMRSNMPEPNNETWYKIDDIRIANQGNYYEVGDIVQVVPKLPVDSEGNEIHDQEDTIMDDVILLRVVEVVDGHVTRIIPLINYAIPYKIWGIRETIAKVGAGRGLSVDFFTSLIEPTDIVDYTDETSDILKPNQFNENDLVAFKFENIHDLDIHYEVFIGGKQVTNFIQRHETVGDPKHPRDIDVIYLPANDVMELQNTSIYVPAENYLVYRINDVIVKDPGAGYCVGQEVFVDAGIVSLRLKVSALDGTPLKGIAAMSISSGNISTNDENPSAANVKIVTDSMNNIDDEYNTGYYDKLPKEGIEKPGTFSQPVEEFTFVAKRFDDLEDGDRNKTFMYPDIGKPGETKGDPDEGWYLGSRIDNSQVPESDERIWNGIMNLVPPTHPFIPDALRLPPNTPRKAEYQRIVDIRLCNCEGSTNTNPTMKSDQPLINAAMHDHDLVVATFADLPRHTEDWALGRSGKRILVEQDETHGGHAMLYTIRTFVASGFFVYDLPEVADMKWNVIDVDWMNCDFRPDEPTRKVQYPTAPYATAKSYREIDREISDKKHEATGAPRIENHTTYIKDLTVDDLSLFNWTTKNWEDLHDEKRWKLTVRDDYDAKDWGFKLELLEEGMYSYSFSLFLNKTPDVLSRNVDLKRDAVVDVVAAVSREVNTPAMLTTVNTGRQIRIRKLFPYEQKETFTVSPANYEMDFKMAPYIHFRNEVHLEDIVIYNKTAGRYEDIMDTNLFEVRFKDPKAYRRGMETHTLIDRAMIGDAGSDFVDGEVWAYNAQYGIHVFGTVKADMDGDGHIITFTPIYCPNIPDTTTSMEFQVYQNISQNKTHAATIIIEFVRETVELFGDGYIHNVQNRLAPVPEEFKVIVKYDLDGPAVYDIIIDKTAKEWEFVYPEWSNTPTFRIKGAPIPTDRLYITTEDGRMPLINPATGTPTFRVTNTTDGMDITILSLYRRYDRIKVHSTPYPMRSVYVQRNIPQSGYINLKGKLNKPLNHRYYEFWVNGKLLYNEVTIISPTKLFLHGLTSLRNFEIIEVNRDPNEYFSNSFLEVEAAANGRPYQSWNYQTYLDAALEGDLEEDNYTKEEQEYLLTPVWKQVERDHPEYKNYPPNSDADPDVLERVKADDNLLVDMDNPLYQFSILDVPTIEGQRITGRRLTFEQFGFIPISDEEIIEMLNEEWADEIADPSIRFPSHAVMTDDQWYGLAARLYDEFGIQVHNLNEAAYKVFDHDLLNIHAPSHSIRIIPAQVHYNLD